MSFSAVYFLYVRIEELLMNQSVDPQYVEILQVLYIHVEFLLEFSKRSLPTKLYREVESGWEKLNAIFNPIEEGDEISVDQVLENLKIEIHSSIPRLKMLEEQCVDGLYNFFPDDDDEKKEEEVVSSKIIGLSDVYRELKDSLMSDAIVTSLVGMPGVGKTTLAKKVFQDPMIVERFDRRVWVRVGKGCRFKDISRLVLAEMDPEEDDQVGDEKLKERLESERCLVVLDDVWDRYTAFFLQPIKFGRDINRHHHFLQFGTGSRILVISRLLQLGDIGPFDVNITARLMDKDESWKLLCEKVFFQGSSCPPQLEKAGKKIAEKCEGLPLTIVAVAALLYQWESTPEFWDEVAMNKNHPLFKDAYDQISKVLLPSYTYLPRILQICFLFVGLFRQNYKIPRSKIINLWRADGFDEIDIGMDLDLYANECLEELVRNNLVMVYQKSFVNYDHTVKTCGLHSSLWHLSSKEARHNNFSIILSRRDEGLDNVIKGHRRLSFHNNVLFGIKDVHKSVETKCASSARSLLCYGPYHQYQVPLCCRLELLRELDAVSIRFYVFPMEVLQLVELRYLTLTVNGMIPPSISQLSKLQFLTLDRHLRIKSSKGPSFLPVEIWELKELKHLDITGSDLPDPCGTSLESLTTLVNVSASSCTEAVVSAIPNLKELRIRIELTPADDGKLFHCFTHISHLQNLEYLKFVIVNPGVARPVLPLSIYEHLSQLSLTGLGYPWKELKKICWSLSLRVLKLKNYAFQGPEWDLKDYALFSLNSLVIEDTDVVDWKIGDRSLYELRELRMKNCYSLQKIHWNFETDLQKVELVDCNPLCVQEMNKGIQENAKHCVVDVQFSWDL